MKKILTAIAFSVMTVTAITVAAQSPGCGAGYGPSRQSGQVSVEDRIDRRVEHMTTRLNLTEEQPQPHGGNSGLHHYKSG